MNAHALLSSQGWRGHGHSLHKTDDTIGLSKPLLLNRKSNTNGLGAANAHFNNDQWWLNAFDEQLKGLETGKKGELKQTVTTGKLNTVQMGSMGKYSVYTNFVSGGLLNGTIGLLETSGSNSTSTSDDESDEKKTKSKDAKKKETKEERRARKAARRVRKEARAARRAAKQQKREDKAKRRAEKGKKSKSSSSSDSSDAVVDEKRLRRAKKEKKRRESKQ